MKHILRYTLFFATILFVASSCKNPVPDQIKYIPKDAMVVLDLNWKNLSDKASSGNINWDSLYHSISDEKADSLVTEGKKKVQDFMRSGVDTTKDILFFMKMGGSIMAGQQVSGGVVGAMKDAAAFEAYLKKQPRIDDIQKGKNYSYTKVEGSFYVGWNSEVVIIAGIGNNQGFGGNRGAGSSETATGNDQYLATLFSLKEEESIAAVPEFRDLIAQKGDMFFWSNTSTALNSVPVLGMTKISDLLKDSYGAGVINFENGKVVANFKSYSGKDLAAIWDKYKGPQVDMNLVSQFPSPVQGYAAFSFNPQVIAEIIKYGGFESTVKQFMDKAGFSLDDVLKIFKGDFAIVFGDIAYTETSYTFDDEVYKTKRPTAKILFNATIGDKAAYDKVMGKLAEAGEVEMVNGQYVPKGLSGIAWNMDGKNLIVASDNTLLQQYLANKGNATIPADIASRSKGKSIAFYVDINKIAATFAADSIAGASAKTAQATFHNAFATSENFNGKFVSSDMELKMVNEKDNSLVSLVKFFAAMSKEAVNMQHRFDARDMSDVDLDEMEDTIAPAAPESE